MRKTHQLGTHLFKLCYEIRKEFGHVLLFTSVERLMVHCVHFTEVPWIVRLAFTLQKICKHLLQLQQCTSMSIISRALPNKQQQQLLI